ncbi:12752_t:CDS:2 [Dentiscutata heterogama]|uniref:12752_t:CDS:1 n=1 Tax=Dentiscutata heterogama TaxID=1316150 RepID=A0ACA9LH86_9GLOM|nr:12752_t:CDS:2 [Dentiscutata heterogama]
MSEKSLSISDMAKLENHSSFHTYVVSPVQAFFHNSCTTSSLVNNFDKLPSSLEITGKSSNQNRLDIPIPSIPTLSIPNVPSSIELAVLAISSAITDAANTAANTARDIAAAFSQFLI